MFVVGLTGGIASGKSVVSKILRELGALLIDADELSREVMLPHKKCWEKVVASFGKEILREDLTIDRKKLAEHVFNNPEQLAKLNSLVHPEIIRLVEGKLEEIKKEDTQAIVIIDAALLVETGMYKNYDRLVVVHAREETQLKRLMARDGISRNEAQKRINSQLPLKEKIKLADFVIENDGSLKETREEVEKVFKTLSSLKSTKILR
ncbi:MAG: hypothetical protein AMJ42_04700 [Deltaproteobacteria bacterium DG_8]|nr:MAG: hypothetical protein AMJ42_04700 [Deltaproteobacteria bacterium DG_8]